MLTLVGCIRGIVLELDGNARYVNAWADDPALLARPPAEMIGRSIEDVLGPSGAQFTAMVLRVFRTGEVEHLEYPLELEGGRRWFFADIKRVGAAESGFTVVFFARDITERKAIEEALARSEERYRLALQATNDVLWDWDLVHDTLSWNVAVTTMLGYTEPGRVGAWWKECIHPDDRSGVIERISHALASDARAWSDSYRFRCADGGYGDFVDRGFIMRDASGRAIRMVGSMTDVTKINRLQAQLLQADRLVALGTLAAGIGHEINNPLSYVIGNIDSSLQLLDDRSNELRELLDEALEGAKRIAETVKSLKDFTRTEGSEARLLDVQQVLGAAIKMADKEIRHRARLVYAFERLPRVRGNESQLAQMFLNLLLNAVQSMPIGRARAHEVRVSTRVVDGSHVVISIEDTGAGLSPDDLSRVFDPFFTTKEARAGAGLGLSICHRIVQQHGGTIAVTSEPGAGSRFTVRLPASAQLLAAGLPRVLVIDDEAAIGRVVTRQFGGRAEVISLMSAREGLTRLSSDEHFDLVLCDLMMPEMTGIELYEELRQVNPGVLGRMFFMTGGAFTANAQTFLDTIATGCLNKPLAREELFALLPLRS
ncbi:MAG: PAS domain S-box protein [Deltaproteobacteria bacterium]|nr:PAS domain S-box protein [Deltaproteobacteria bacterium]